MKKFDPQKELNNLRTNNKSEINNMMVPLLVIGCAMLGMVGYTFSVNLENKAPKEYTIKLDLENTNVNSYVKTVKEGKFSDKIDTDSTFASINCTKGDLKYNAELNTIYSDNINSDVECVVSYLGDGTKMIDFNSMNTINDNTGISYYYQGDSANNYVRFHDMIFRIVRVNGDGSYRLLLDSSIGSGNIYNYNDILVNWFNTYLATDEYIVTSDYDYNNYSLLNESNLSTLVNMDSFNISNVGLLSLKEVYNINKGVTNSYIPNNMLLGNKYDESNTWITRDGNLNYDSNYGSFDIRPVINIKAVKFVGQGTIESPFEIGDK
jgi:hypothetical protein